MKTLALVSIFLFCFCDAQNTRFTYEYSFDADSTQKENIQKEMVVLDVFPTGSKFFSYQKFKSDSLLNIELERQKHADSQFIKYNTAYKGKIPYTISKDYPSYTTYLHIGIGTDRYKVFDDRKMAWEIKPDKMQIGEFQTQKAETEMFGRKWTAWFTTEIPLQDGPYKFQGLPGLIVKIEDLSKTHSFELKGISKDFNSQSSGSQETWFHAKEIPVTYAQYKKMYLELQNDPTKALREMMNRPGVVIKMMSSDGTELKPADILRKREQDAKENRRKNNNPLELDLEK